MSLLIAQNHFEQFRAPIKIILCAQNNSCIPVPVRLKQIIETEGHRDMTDFLAELFNGGLDASQTAAMHARMDAAVAAESSRISTLKATLAAKASTPRCTRCGGTGRLSQFMHRNNGACYGCGGSGSAS
jgi:hypothetical protein